MTGRTMKMPVAQEWQSVSAERTASYRRQIVDVNVLWRQQQVHSTENEKARKLKIGRMEAYHPGNP